MNSKYLIILSLLLVQACTIINEIFPEEKVQVVDPVRRKPMLNGNLNTTIGLHANNSVHGVFPSPPQPPLPLAKHTPVAQNAQNAVSAPVLVAQNPSNHNAFQKPIALPNAPAFKSPYAATPTAPIVAAPSVPVTSAPIAAPLPVVTKVAAKRPPLQNHAAVAPVPLAYPKLSEVKGAQVKPNSVELDKRVQNLKRELEAARQEKVVAAPVKLPVRKAPVIKPLPNEPIITRSAQVPPAPVRAFAPVIPPAPIAQPAYAPARSASRQTITLPSQLRMPGSSAVRTASARGVNIADEDYNDGYIYNTGKKYRHSNLRRGY